MKKLARIVGILGGLAALLWAMRDRLVSIAAPREPQPPRFRVVPPPDDVQLDDSEPEDDLTSIRGIGPVFAERLRDKGIRTVEDLARAEPEKVAEMLGVPTSRAEDLVRQASSLTAG